MVTEWRLFGEPWCILVVTILSGGTLAHGFIVGVALSVKMRLRSLVAHGVLMKMETCYRPVKCMWRRVASQAFSRDTRLE
jgi:hypothetical protein